MLACVVQMNRVTAVITTSLISKPVSLYLKNPLKAFGVLCVQYDQLTLICEQSEAKSKQYRQPLPPVVQSLMKPDEPLAKEEEALSGARSQ